jgi:hypothetical protein
VFGKSCDMTCDMEKRTGFLSGPGVETISLRRTKSTLRREKTWVGAEQA